MKVANAYEACTLINANTINLQFVLCDSCFWCATGFKVQVQNIAINVCPMCFNDNLSLIPLGQYESYKKMIEPKLGLEIKFSTHAGVPLNSLKFDGTSDLR
jgi:hypothetical protein